MHARDGGRLRGRAPPQDGSHAFNILGQTLRRLLPLRTVRTLLSRHFPIFSWLGRNFGRFQIKFPAALKSRVVHIYRYYRFFDFKNSLWRGSITESNKKPTDLKRLNREMEKYRISNTRWVDGWKEGWMDR